MPRMRRVHVAAMGRICIAHTARAFAVDDDIAGRGDKRGRRACVMPRV